MANLNSLEKRLNALENRLKQLEAKLANPVPQDEQVWLNQLYQKAKDLVIKHQNASLIFLQRKLFIDYARATTILALLEKNGVIGPESLLEPRKILIKSLPSVKHPA